MFAITSHDDSTPASHRLLLLRHGEVTSHKGDVPVTNRGLAYAQQVGAQLAAIASSVNVLNGETRRTQQTASAIADGARSAGLDVSGPAEAHAMRNPDIYVAGTRVSMVSTPEALAAQVPGMSNAQAAEVPFFEAFFAAKDRIRFWLDCEAPPGESSADVAERIEAFAASLVDMGAADRLTVGVTHSPILRSVMAAQLGEDPGEPAWVSGVAAEIHADRQVRWVMLSDPLQLKRPTRRSIGS